MVWIKRLNTGDPGDSTHVGGAQWDLLDQYHDNVDIGAPVKINTTTRFRSGKFILRDSDDTHDFIFTTSNISSNITMNMPSGWPSTVTPAVLEDTGQTFTVAQTIERTGGDDGLILRRVSSTPGDDVNVTFQALDSLSNVTTYARISSEIVDATDASEDGKMVFEVSDNGTMTPVFELSPGGISFGDILAINEGINIGHDTIAQITSNQNNYAPSELANSSFMRISANAARDITGIDDFPDRLLVLRNVGSFPITLKNQSGSSNAENRFDFGRDIILGASRTLPMYYDQTSDRWVGLLAGAALIDNPNVFADLQTIQRDASSTLLDLYRTDNSVGNTIDLSFYLDDSAANKTQYGLIQTEIGDATNGSEDGQLNFKVMKGGVLTTMVNIKNTGLSVALEDYDTLEVYRPSNVVDNDQVGIVLAKNNSSSAKVGVGYIYGNLLTNTAGAEESEIQFFAKRGGANIETMVVSNQGDLTLYDSANGSDIYLGRIGYWSKDSANNVQEFGSFYAFKDDATSGSEDMNFGFDMEVAGSIHNTHWLSPAAIGVQDAAMSGIWHYQRTNNIRGSGDKTQYWSNGTAYIPCYLDSNVSVSTIISNSSAEQTIYSNTTPIMSMNQNGFMEMTIHGYILQNQATGTTFTFRAKFGGVTMWEDVTLAIGQNATRLPFTIKVKVWNKGVENAQGMAGQIYLNDGSAATTGIGDINDDEGFVFGTFDSDGNDGARDTAAGTQSFSVSAQASVASSSVTLVRRHVDLLLVTAG